MSVHEDRRDARTQRVPFEAIVEIGGTSEEASAFEAQGVDLSASGMHLRTAYLPDIGQPLLCRFDGSGHEVSAEANVIWRREGSRGGEFGIQFTNLDDGSAEALREMCGLQSNGSDEPAEQRKNDVDPGTRVRLHIDGLGSPMKARVRGSSEDELLVGSNLEFLKVGRTLELEDVDRGGKRPAHIDRVDVEIDRVSKVPQLIVTLRYDDAPGETASVIANVPSRTFAAAGSAPRASQPSLPSSVDSGTEGSVKAAPAPSSSHSDSAEDDAEEARLMRSKFSHAASDLAPTLARLGSRAKTTAALLLGKAFERASTTTRGAAPRRTTAPPPTGALHATGKRVVRDSAEADSSDESMPRRKVSQKTMMMGIGGASGLLVVLLGVAFHKPATPPPGANAAASGAAEGAELAANPPAGATATATTTAVDTLTASGPTQANMPLFGPTTLSTTEPVAPPAQTAMFGAPLTGSAPAAVAPGSSMQVSSGSDGEEDTEDGRSDSKKHVKIPTFGHNKIVDPVVMRLKTDGIITAMHGMRTPTGFTIALPGRHAQENAIGTAAHDARIAALHVSNGSKGAELNVQFKDGIPPYAVRVRGHDIVISLGKTAGPSSSNEESTHPATAKTGSSRRHRGDRE